MNEFGTLTPDELHFLRVFIYCEGRIRDMEAALGVSYPTVKGHMASIKEKLNLARIRPAAPSPAPASAAPGAEGSTTTEEVLESLEAGQISYKDAVRLLKAKKKEAKNDEKQGS